MLRGCVSLVATLQKLFRVVTRDALESLIAAQGLCMSACARCVAFARATETSSSRDTRHVLSYEPLSTRLVCAVLVLFREAVTGRTGIPRRQRESRHMTT
jgi:hypothetical protein